MAELEITERDTVRRCQNHVMSSIGDDTVLLDLEQNDYFGMNAVGTRVWELLESARPVASLCRRLEEEFSVPPDQCQADVLAFLNQLAKEGLVEAAV